MEPGAKTSQNLPPIRIKVASDELKAHYTPRNYLMIYLKESSLSA